MLEEIAKMLTEYNIAIEHFEWLRENKLINADEDIGLMAYQLCVRSGSPEMILAFKAVMELVTDNQVRQTLKGKLREKSTDLINEAAEDARADVKRLSSEYFKNR